MPRTAPVEQLKEGRLTTQGLSQKRTGAFLNIVWRYRYPYLFIAPFFILFAIFGVFPYGYAFFLSFTHWDGIGPQVWAGLDNYVQLLGDSLWWKSLYNGAWLLVVTTLNLPIALVLAFIINSKFVRFRSVFRTAYFMPIVAAPVAVSMVFISLFGKKYGALNYLLHLVGLPPAGWLTDPAWVKPSIALVVIWSFFGWNVIIYLAGLQSIPPELYEAARTDGANTRQIFVHITIPAMWPIINFTLVLSIIGALQLFDIPLLLGGGTHAQTMGGIDNAGLTPVIYLYDQAFHFLNFGYSSTVSVALFIVIILFSYIYYRVLGREREN